MASDVPARLLPGDTAGQAILQETVNAALGSPVMLADDALTSSNRLLIERRGPRTMDNPNPGDRTMERPIVMVLVQNGDDCVLVDSATGGRYLLAEVHCEAL